MQTSRATSKVHAAGMQPQADQFEEWHPMHLHEVVAVTMVIKNWMRPRDRAVERQKREEKSAINELNTSMVFEPMPITMERIRMLKQLGRTPSSSSLIRSIGGGGIGPDSNSKMSSATSAEILPSPVAVVPDAGQPTLLQMESTPQRQPTEPLPPIRLPTPNTNRNNNIRKTQEHQQQQATGTETSPNHQMASNGRAGGDGHNRMEPTESNTTVGQERGLLGEGRRILIPSRKAVADCLRAASRAFMALPNVSVQPTGKFYAYWTFLIYLAFLYNAFVAVLFVFDDTQANTFFGLWLILNALTDCINLTDLFLNSRLSYMDDGVLVKDWRRLTKRYLHNWHFPLDLFALFPSDLLLLLNRNFSLVRVNRLAKCYRVWEFVQMTNVRTNYPNAFRILHIVVVCMVLFHWNAALYFKISLFHGIFTTDPSAWEFNYVKNQDPIWVRCGQVLWDQIPEGSCGFNESGRGDPDTERVNYLPEMISYWKDRSFPLHFSNFSKQYSLSFYWSSLTLTTSGQQPYPTAAMHNFLEIFDTIVGVLVFAVIVGSVGNVVTTMNRGRAEIQQLNDGIKFYMNYRHVSDAMQKRVLDCIHYIQRHAQIQNEESIMAAIPPRLQGELAVHLHMETLRQADLFAEADPALLYELVLRLRMQMFAPNDFLCRRGDLAKEMYVLKRGVLEVLDEQGEQTRFGQGNIFGEMSILKAGGQAGKLLARRRHCLRSVGYSEVYLLSQEDALDVFADYPEQRQQLIQRATEILLESGDVQPQELLERGPFSPLELCGTETGSEVLQLLKDTLEGLDKQLDGLYTKFTKNSAELKQQMTALEADYRETRLLKKEQKRMNARGKKRGEAIVKEKL